MKLQTYSLIALLLVIFLFTGCNSESENRSVNSETSRFSLEQSIDSDSAKLDINRYLAVKSAILLEFKEDRPIQNIHKLIINGPELFILDNVQNYIYVYAIQGNYHNRIGSIGNGPGEYLDITDFIIDDDEAVVFSNNSQKIIRFSTSGALIKEIPIQYFGESIVSFDDGYVLYTKGNVYPEMPYDLLLLDSEGILIDHKQKIQRELPSMESTGFLVQPENTNLRYMEIFSDIIYDIDKDFNLLPLYQIDLGANKLDIDHIKSPEELLAHYYEHTFLTNFFWENDRLALLYYFHKKRMSFGMILKPERQLVTQPQFHPGKATKIIRSVNATTISGNKLLIATRPIFNQSEENYETIDSLVSWGPGVFTSDKSDLIENSNGLIFEFEVVQ